MKALRILAIVLAACAVGCPTNKMAKKELASVAKDWMTMIRASQVIPVYPLTEDLQPGDIFLVETPMQEQHKEWKKEGYLRLDQHFGRLEQVPYEQVYDSSYGLGECAEIPKCWQFPLADDSTTVGDDAGGGEPKPPNGWQKAPRAAFPTYGFDVSSGAGLNLGLPIEGVPVGLSIMKTSSASGTITIADAYSYGVPYEDLQLLIEAWERAPRNRALLAEVKASLPLPAEGEAARRIYLRVIQRVYLTQRVVVSMQSSKAKGASLEAGAADKSDLFRAEHDTSKNYDAMLERLNKAIKPATPGGALTVLQASGHSVSMSETFPRPLVVGYLSFDFEILDGGGLGPPLATTQALESGRGRVSSQTRSKIERRHRMLRLALDGIEDESTRTSVCEAAATSAGKDFVALYEEQTRAGDGACEAFRDAKHPYLMSKGTPVERYLLDIVLALEAAFDEIRP